jgi:hypothetical protein
MAIEYWIAIEKFEGVSKSSKSKDRQYTDQLKRDKKTKYRLRLHVNVIYKKNLKISKVHSESVNRRTVKTLVLQMETKGQPIIYKTIHGKLKSSNMNTTKNQGWTRVLRKGKQFPLHCRVTLVTNPVVSYTRDIAWLRLGQTEHFRGHFVTQIFQIYP